MPNAMPTDWNVELGNIERQRKYAEMLRQQSLDPIKTNDTAGGYVVPINPLQGLAKMLQAYGGRRGDEIATEQSKEVVAQRNKAMADTLRGAFEPKTESVPYQDDAGEAMGVGTPEGLTGGYKQTPRTPQEISQALLSNPDTMQLGGQMMVADAKGQADLNRALQTEAFKQQMKATAPGEQPSNVREWEYFKNLNPADQQKYLNVKRQMYEVTNIGNVPNLVGRLPGLTPTPLSTLPQEVEGKAAVARGVEAGKAKGEADVSLVEMQANLPRLEVVVKQLDGLGKEATYTKVGQARDILQRELGMDPGAAAIARKEYIAKVDNEVLPLLRQTFGAQFTQKEGESLKVTLGDPNASPAEKAAVLRSFIDSKRAQVETQKRKVGLSGGGQPETKTINGKTYIKQNGQWFEQ